MRLTFLGTGTSTGIPEIGCSCATCLSSDPRDQRTRTSALVEVKGLRVMIDCGPDFRVQMLREGVGGLDAIILTHEHYDHVAGIDDIRPLFRDHRPCPIYAEPNVIEALRTRMPYAFGERKYPGAPDIDLIPIAPGILVSLSEEVTLLPIRVMHGKLPIVGFKIGSLGYVTDCKAMPRESLSLLRGIDTLVINALRKYEHPAHLSLDEALHLISLIAPKQTYLVHFAHTFGRHIEIAQGLPPFVYPAYDGLQVEIED